MDTPAPDHPPERLTDRPDWGYLLTEFHEMYRNSGAGGSEKIRSHQRRVREAISKVLRDAPEVRVPDPVDKPVTRHLPRTLDRGTRGPTEQFVAAIRNVTQWLAWQYGYDRVPRGLAEKYAFAELAGPRGPVVTERVILGLVLFAPDCTYPAHAHEGITESYYVLSGSVSENHAGVYAPGSMIFNPPGHMHRITVGARNPALLAYAWIGPASALAGQTMVFSRPRRGGS
jgi:dimethylpropiothetin dethiomethylase